jgi:HAD superfamily hydrolase (TIGR01509 family)
MSAAAPVTSVLVFDMGGVLYDFQGAELIVRVSRRPLRKEEVRASWVPLVRRFETGACGEGEFAASVVDAYGLEMEPAVFVTAFRTAAIGFYDGALSLIELLRRRYRVLSLSNTNPVQWPEVLAALGPGDPFHAHYPSHLSGFHKPDARAYEAIASGHPKADFFFFDDRADNVAAATELGWRARQVRGVAETRRACLELGLLAG